MAKRVLFVLTSHDDLGGGAKTGSWLEELAASYYTLTKGGFRVVLASVKGGDAPIDPASLEDPWITDSGRRFLDDGQAMGKVKQSLRLADVTATDYDAVYLIGGAGTAWDFPDNDTLAEILATVEGRKGVIAGVCHGVSGLLNKANGKAIGAGRNVTCISDREDEMAGYDKLVPLLPESSLKGAGANVLVGDPFAAHVVVDGNFVTGQNPASAAGVAEAILKQLGR